jgi:hypothetical protein
MPSYDPSPSSRNARRLLDQITAARVAHDRAAGLVVDWTPPPPALPAIQRTFTVIIYDPSAPGLISVQLLQLSAVGSAAELGYTAIAQLEGGGRLGYLFVGDYRAMTIVQLRATDAAVCDLDPSRDDAILADARSHPSSLIDYTIITASVETGELHIAFERFSADLEPVELLGRLHRSAPSDRFPVLLMPGRRPAIVSEWTMLSAQVASRDSIVMSRSLFVSTASSGLWRITSAVGEDTPYI